MPRQTQHLIRAGLVVCALGCGARPALADGTSILDTRGLSLPDVGNAYGHGATLAVGTAGLWAAGHLTNNPNTVGAAGDLAKGLVLDAALVVALKAGIDRTRPDGPGTWFPSGATAGAFTVAPILTSRFGWKVGVPAYGLATITALSAIEDNQPFPSGAVAGATLGVLVGEAVVHHGDKLHLPGPLTVGRKGLGLRFKF